MLPSGSAVQPVAPSAAAYRFTAPWWLVYTQPFVATRDEDTTPASAQVWAPVVSESPRSRSSYATTTVVVLTTTSLIELAPAGRSCCHTRCPSESR